MDITELVNFIAKEPDLTTTTTRVVEHFHVSRREALGCLAYLDKALIVQRIGRAKGTKFKLCGVEVSQ